MTCFFKKRVLPLRGVCGANAVVISGYWQGISHSHSSPFVAHQLPPVCSLYGATRITDFIETLSALHLVVRALPVDNTSCREGPMSAWIQFCVALSLVMLVSTVNAQEGGMVELPTPVTTGGMPLMQALQQRHSTREFSPKPLPKQVLSNLLWAAVGVNRPASGKRTVPSARDWREVDVYVALPEGTYLYDGTTHALVPVRNIDLRAATGVQDFVGQAPVNLVYIADLDRMDGASEDQKEFYAAADTGFIAQNVYLYCASEGLATVVRGSVDRETLAKKLGLNKHQRIILAQTVGYPAR
jgi:SagB-type dehydrogenase family enzyme